jgi:hypothetical protein
VFELISTNGGLSGFKPRIDLEILSPGDIFPEDGVIIPPPFLEMAVFSSG